MSSIVRVKFLYRAALDQWESGHPYAAGMTISLLQDAVEAMAHDAAASVRANPRSGAGLFDYWEAISKVKNGKELPCKVEMGALNSARVGFKHHGTEHSPSEVEKHIAAAHRFLQQTAHDFFGLDFDGLSEADLINETGIRDALKAAEAALARDDVTTALERCRDALDVVEALQKETIPVAERNPMTPSIPREARAFADGILKWIARRFAALKVSVPMSVLGVNPAEVWFLYGTLSSKNHVGVYHWPHTKSLVSTRTRDRAQTSIRIDINLALRLDRVRADLKRLEVRTGLAEEERRRKEWQDRVLNQVSTEAGKPDSPG